MNGSCFPAILPTHVIDGYTFLQHLGLIFLNGISNSIPLLVKNKRALTLSAPVKTPTQNF